MAFKTNFVEIKKYLISVNGEKYGSSLIKTHLILDLNEEQ